MSATPDELKYSADHVWIRMEDDFIGVCGLTDHAQEQLTDIVFVELPEIDTDVRQGERLAVVESVKATTNVNAPVSGRIVEVNTALEDSPGVINADPYGDGWIFKIDVKGRVEYDDLMDADQYRAQVE
ncbi:MAG TPA: glycine cleavage system protein GcvH [Spirochaetota bacterium]|nr:glycine cleavage system protein GcvH [Spirochaetota bacterium]HOQ61685.1 glycine cleavage system protein GcvH [Vicinamibacterales bacterium]HNT12950.1 glycine cleavage system protein GcvH [Spirochaetota bacterium]HNV46991.1 glycine cleavage system protein GcvH [Spirochaetota bacterium]HPI22620.1 glycine cleavage system protein GcvH [Spirochaetota bacterium]